MINSSVINSGLAQLPEGVPKELYSTILTLYNAVHNLESAISTYTGADTQPTDFWNQLSIDDTLKPQNLNRIYPIMFEEVSYGEMVSPILVGGAVLLYRKASATDLTRFAAGIVNTPGNIAAGSRCEVILMNGLVAGISNLIPGSIYYLDDAVPGRVVNIPPTTHGHFQQSVGLALASNRLFMNISLDLTPL